MRVWGFGVVLRCLGAVYSITTFIRAKRLFCRSGRLLILGAPKVHQGRQSTREDRIERNPTVAVLPPMGEGHQPGAYLTQPHIYPLGIRASLRPTC